MIISDNISILFNGEWHALEQTGKYSFSYKDIIVELEGETLKVTAHSSRVQAIKITLPKPFSNKAKILGDAWERMYGDAAFREKVGEMPWYFIALDNNLVYAYGVKTQPNALCCWEVDSDKIAFIADVSSGKIGVLLDGRTLTVSEFVIREFERCDVYEASRLFCNEMCENAILPKQPIYGGNDWYCNYGNSSSDKILQHAKWIAECAPENSVPPYMVIDDGWQLCHHNKAGSGYFNGGPWKYCNKNFLDMKKLADEIKALGVLPGIWMRPLLTTEKFPDEYILKYVDTKYTLDPSVPEVLEQVKSDIRELVRWGYKLIKHDFTSYDIFGKFANGSDYRKIEHTFKNTKKTTAEIIKDLYCAIREAAGNDVVIIGCNTISHLAAGFFEIQRTGDDTSGIEWERTKKMGVNTLAFRMCQHNTFYAADADCVGITKEIPWDKNIQWLDVLSKSGTPLFVSIAEDSFNETVKTAIQIAFERAIQAQKPSKPIDWIDSLTPSLWESDFGTDTYIW